MSHTVPEPPVGPLLEDMTWRDFERAMAVAFEAQGYRATVTADGADGGVDLVLRKPGELVLVQCKHWNAWSVGVKTVRELLGVMTVQHATGGIVAISGRFTDEARQFARQAGITLLGRPEVVAMLKAAPLRFSDGTGAAAGQAPRMGGPRCPRCGEPMAVRIANRGPRRGERFWGCPRFPHCRGVAPFVGPTPQRGPQAQAVPPLHGARPMGPPGRPRNRTARRLLVGALVVVAAMLLLPGLVLAAWASMVRSIASPIPVSTTRTYPTGIPSVGQPTTSKPTDSRVVASIQLPMAPNKVAVDSEGHRLYVTALEKNSLIMIDLTTNTVVSTVSLQRQPGQVAFDSVTHTIWITNYNDASVTVLDQEGTAVAVLQVGQGPSGVAIDPGLHKAYVANALDKSLTVIDTATRRTLSRASVGWPMADATVDTVDHLVCFDVTLLGDMGYCYDGPSLTAKGGFYPSGTSIAVDSITHAHYAVTPSLASLRVLDAVTHKSSEVPFGSTPTGVAVDPATHLAYVADHTGNLIFVVKAL